MLFFWVLLLCLILLLGIAFARALLLRPRRALGAVPAPPSHSEAQAYAAHLGTMLQFATINNASIPHETIAASFAGFRAAMGAMYPLTFQALEEIPLENQLLLRWKGADSKRGAIVLMSHTDVVPATGEWQQPPFSGAIADDCIWGRGAMDTKGALCAIFEAVEALLAAGFTPVCDVYISSSHNEETMGNGAKNAVAYLKQNGVDFAIVSDEGGAVIEPPLPGIQGKAAMLGIVEKGFANVRFVAKSGGGHASAPPKGTPLARLAAFVQDVEQHPPFQTKLTQPVKAMFAAFAPYMALPYRMLFGNVWLFGPLLCWLLPRLSPQAGAMLHTTCAFTMAQGSLAPNVIPAEASITANLRFIMHQNSEQSLEVLAERAAKHQLEMVVDYLHEVSPTTDMQSAEYQYFAACVAKVFPEAIISPYTMIAGTDARDFAPHCPCTVRFAPLLLNPQQFASIHGIDENIGVVSLARAVAFYKTLLQDYQ